MNPEVKAEWLQALRSGEYKQGTGRLQNYTDEGSEFCCLGVLCDLAVKAGVIPKPEHDQEDSCYVYGTGDDIDHNLLPRSVQNWAGLGTSGPQVEWLDDEGHSHNRELAVLNDDGTSFEEIANLIEEDL